ncbi:hypothetical protein, partial [Kocuria palustris]|uniref:hypothetical protein n=1 Tax=Kocuria palustris TaxID=71999 RepID=UPI00331D2544
GDLSTVSGLIGQRSCGNVVVRGVNDVVTQDTVIPSRIEGPGDQQIAGALVVALPAGDRSAAPQR